MRKPSILLLGTLLPMLALAQGWPAGYGGVMMQGFFWDSYLVDPDFGPNGTQVERDKGKINYVNHTNPWGSDVTHTWAMMYEAGWPTGTDDWEVPATTWTNLSKANVRNAVTPFIDLLWLPQSGATIAPALQQFGGATTQTRYMRGGAQWDFEPGNWISNPDCNGFVPYLWFDHGRGEKYTYTSGGNTIEYTSKSYFGTEQELKDMIAAYKAENTLSVEDVVINHKGFAGDFWFDETYTDPETGAPTSTKWTKNDLVGLTYRDGGWQNYYYTLDGTYTKKTIEGGGQGKDDGEYGGWANEVAHTSLNAQRNSINYLKYLKDNLGYSGFRYDYAKGLAPGRFAQYNVATTPAFSVGENWDIKDVVSAWVKNTTMDGAIRSAAFDFELLSKMRGCFNDANFYGLVAVVNDDMINDNLLKRYAVTFVANHDTNKNLPTDTSNPDYGNRISHNIVEANAFILAMPGTPCLFWAHFMHPGWHDDICKMILARRAAGITNQAIIEEANTKGTGKNPNGAQWVIKGDKGKLLLQLGTDAVTGQAPDPQYYTVVFESSICRLSISTELAAEVNLANVYDGYNASTLAGRTIKNTYKKPELANGYPVFSKPAGSYTGQVEVTLSPSDDGCTVVYTTDGTVPTATSRRLADGESKTFTLTETTAIRAGLLVDGAVAPSSVVRNDYVITTDEAASGKTVVYVHDPNATSASSSTKPYIYAWNGDNQDQVYTSAWPGWQMTASKQIGGLYWHEATLTATNFNMILSEGTDTWQTHNINNVRHEVFYTFKDGIATDVTSTYARALHDPFVSIDKASGEYSGNLTVTLNSSVEGATVVYSIDKWDTDLADDNSRQSTTAAATTLSFNTDGAHLLRAAVLKNGKVINKVVRTYDLTGTTNNTINIYVQNRTTTAAPHIYAWYNNGSTDVALTNSFSSKGNTLTTTATNCGQTWYKYTFTNRSDVKLLFMLTGSADQTSDIEITAPGDYYYYYYPGAHMTGHNGYIDVTGDSKHTTTKKTITISFRNNSAAYIYAWVPTECFGGYPGKQFSNFPQKDGWYYATFVDASNVKFKFAQSYSGSSTGDISNSTSAAYYYPQDGNNWSSAYYSSSDAINDRSISPTAESGGVVASTLPSCASYLPGTAFCYFENSWQMAVPTIWAWNDTKNLSGVAWPGDGLTELVGIAPDGNAIYRWSCTDSGTPTKVIFSDNGNNQTSEFTFTNGGYYTASGLVGTVPDNLRTLADLKKSIATGQTVVLSNNLQVGGYDAATKCLYVKDADGSANDLSINTTGKPEYTGGGGFNVNYLRDAESNEYDQSNWVKIDLSSLTSSNDQAAIITAAGSGNPVLGQTLLGTVTDATCPTVKVSARPVFDTKTDATYHPNTYIPAHFRTTSEDYFFVQPKNGEYCHVLWACYWGEKDGKYIFTLPANDTGLQGVLAVTAGDNARVDGNRDFDPDQHLVEGRMYELVGVVNYTDQAGSPRRVDHNDGNKPGEAIDADPTIGFEVAYFYSEKPIVTVVDDLTAGTREVMSVTYYDIAGHAAHAPHHGVNIVVTRYTDGTTESKKVVNN